VDLVTITSACSAYSLTSGLGAGWLEPVKAAPQNSKRTLTPSAGLSSSERFIAGSNPDVKSNETGRIRPPKKSQWNLKRIRPARVLADRIVAEILVNRHALLARACLKGGY